MSLTFVVSTGRCGSTALSQILHDHPDVLSISELFSMLKGTLLNTGFPAHPMDGQELWEILTATDSFADARIRDGLTTPEMTYPYGSGRFDPATGVPLICHNLLPMLSSDPDTLFGELAAEVPGWPRRPAASQYRALFAFLAGRLGRRAVVERSGASLTLVRTLHREFPEARFVHLHRDGPDCALSMSRHPVFRLTGLTAAAARAAGLPASLSLDESVAAVRQLQAHGQLPAAFEGLVTWPFDTQRYLGYPLPVAFFADLWSSLVCQGVAALEELPAGSWMSLRYEDLLADPSRRLAEFAAFAGVPALPAWLDRAAALIGGHGPGSDAAAQLTPAELAAVQVACEPGTAAIARAANRAAAPSAGHPPEEGRPPAPGSRPLAPSGSHP